MCQKNWFLSMDIDNIHEKKKNLKKIIIIMKINNIPTENEKDKEKKITTLPLVKQLKKLENKL
jgi:hypothetical protein